MFGTYTAPAEPAEKSIEITEEPEESSAEITADPEESPIEITAEPEEDLSDIFIGDIPAQAAPEAEEPDVPEEPEEPVEPEVPAEPEEPVEPEVPAEPETEEKDSFKDEWDSFGILVEGPEAEASEQPEASAEPEEPEEEAEIPIEEEEPEKAPKPVEEPKASRGFFGFPWFTPRATAEPDPVPEIERPLDGDGYDNLAAKPADEEFDNAPTEPLEDEPAEEETGSIPENLAVEEPAPVREEQAEEEPAPVSENLPENEFDNTLAEEPAGDGGINIDIVSDDYDVDEDANEFFNPIRHDEEETEETLPEDIDGQLKKVLEASSDEPDEIDIPIDF